MKQITLTAALFFCLALALSAAEPALEPGVELQNGTGPFAINYMTSVTFPDWNNDGKKDIVVSQFSYGYVWLFLNLGTDLNPIFDGGAMIESAGAPINTSYG